MTAGGALVLRSVAHWRTAGSRGCASLAPGLILAAMIGRLAQRRLVDDAIVDLQPTTGAAGIDRRVLVDTGRQVTPVPHLRPGAARGGGPGVPTAPVLSFAAMPARFRAGHDAALRLRALRLAGTFHPAALAGLWGLWHLAAARRGAA